MALLTEMALLELKALFAIGAFVAALALVDFRAIHAGLAVVRPVAMDGILVMIRFDCKVAVLAPSALVHIFAVL